MAPSKAEIVHGLQDDLLDALRNVSLTENISELPGSTSESAKRFQSGPSLLDHLQIPQLQVDSTSRHQKVAQANSDDDWEDEDEDEDEDVEPVFDSDSDDDDDGRASAAGIGFEKLTKQYLRDLYPSIVDKCCPPAVNHVLASLRPTVVPYPHQWRAAETVIKLIDGQFKGLLIADPPGLGKTLSALLSMGLTREPGDPPAIVVAPSSACQQWIREISKYFHPGTMRATILSSREPLSPTQLFEYDIVVVSYSYLSSEVSRMRRYRKQVMQYSQRKSGVKPKRPRVTLLSGLFLERPTPLSKFLILDEAHTFKNIRGATYFAVSLLRELCTYCVMMTGTPLDNTWIDCLAILKLLLHHPFISTSRMRLAFTPGGKQRTPTGKYKRRLIQLLDALTLRRPVDIIAHLLPTLEKEVVQFDLSPYDLTTSNEHYDQYVKASRLNRKKKNMASRRSTRGKGDKKCGWASLIKAQQAACHPRLIDIMEMYRASLDQNLAGVEASNAAVGEEDEAHLKEWRESLAKHKLWRSQRVMSIIDIFDKHRDERPDDAFLIMDESIYFLDILEIAFKNTDDPVPIFRFDGRHSPAERTVCLDKFWNATGCRVLLVTRGTGGMALNMQCANVLIRCGPWWKKSWDEQSEGRIWRTGQTKPCYIYELRARECNIEDKKAKTRDAKHALNDNILGACTHSDPLQAPAPRHIT